MRRVIVYYAELRSNINCKVTYLNHGRCLCYILYIYTSSTIDRTGDVGWLFGRVACLRRKRPCSVCRLVGIRCVRAGFGAPRSSVRCVFLLRRLRLHLRSLVQ